MEKLKEYLFELKEHKQMIRPAAIIFIVIAAAVFFGQNGEKSESAQVSLQLEETPPVTSGEQISGRQPAEAATEDREDEPEIYIDISGRVKHPGVYSVPAGSRLFEVIEEAGGLLKDAEMDQVNRAEVVTDGQKIIIPAKGEQTSPVTGMTASGLININTADSITLQEIPGVGPATAEKIIAYRTENGRFAAKEDIKNVSGIGDKTYEKMKDRITV